MGLYSSGHIYEGGGGLIFGMLIGLLIWGAYIWGGLIYGGHINRILQYIYVKL